VPFIYATCWCSTKGLTTCSSSAPLECATPLIVVMGHQRWGAVIAAVESLEHGTDLGPYLDWIVIALEPAYNVRRAPASRKTSRSTRRFAGRQPSPSGNWKRTGEWRH
jgi:carbonic anhydrase